MSGRIEFGAFEHRGEQRLAMSFRAIVDGHPTIFNFIAPRAPDESPAIYAWVNHGWTELSIEHLPQAIKDRILNCLLQYRQ